MTHQQRSSRPRDPGREIPKNLSNFTGFGIGRVDHSVMAGLVPDLPESLSGAKEYLVKAVQVNHRPFPFPTARRSDASSGIVRFAVHKDQPGCFALLQGLLPRASSRGPGCRYASRVENVVLC
jgi:hypothetical protein